MPKEITHWHIGTEALKKSNLLYSKMKESPLYESAFLLGSVSHDSPYFSDIFTPGSEIIGEFLHGKDGEDTFLIVRKFLNHSFQYKDTIKRNISFYFGLGLLSHIILDSELHPLIYYLTGDYYAKKNKERRMARTAHRNLESIMDSYIYNNVGTSYDKTSIISILKNIPDFTPLLSELTFNFTKDHISTYKKYNKNSYLDFWKYHAILFSLFSGKISGSFIRKFPLIPKSIRAVAKTEQKELFYFLEKQYHFQGEYISLVSLLEKAKLRLVDHFLSLECYLLDHKDKSSLIDEWGPSLNTGIPGKGLPDNEYSLVPEFLIL